MKRQAFTLVELLVVIAIIALLVGILLPSLGRAREIARHAVCRTCLHDVGVGFRMYLDQSSDMMPFAAELPSANLNNYPRIADVLAPFLSDLKTLWCPSDNGSPYSDNGTSYYAAEGSSYDYRSMLSGQKITSASQRAGETGTYVMYDYEPFHGLPGALGSANFLFANGDVGDLQ